MVRLGMYLSTRRLAVYVWGTPIGAPPRPAFDSPSGLGFYFYFFIFYFYFFFLVD